MLGRLSAKEQRVCVQRERALGVDRGARQVDLAIEPYGGAFLDGADDRHKEIAKLGRCERRCNRSKVGFISTFSAKSPEL